MRESPYKSPEKGDTSAYTPALALLHFNPVYTSVKITPILQR